MNKIILIALVILVSNCLLAQGTQIKLYGAYVFDDGFDSHYSNNEFIEGKIEGGLQWGLGIEYPSNNSFGIEAMYLRQDFNSLTTSSTGNLNLEPVNFNFAFTYLMPGGVLQLRKSNQPLEFYDGLMADFMSGNIGHQENRNNSIIIKFTWVLKAGIVYCLSNNPGHKLQAQLISAVQSAGGLFYFDGYGGRTRIIT